MCIYMYIKAFRRKSKGEKREKDCILCIFLGKKKMKERGDCSEAGAGQP